MRVGERFVELTRTEYQLLELLMLNPRRVLPHDLIYDRVWGYDFGPASNALRVYVGYLRRKLEDAGARPLIHTVRGVGYVPARAVSLRTRIAAAAARSPWPCRRGGGRGRLPGVRAELRGEVDHSLATCADAVARFAEAHAARRARSGSGPPTAQCPEAARTEPALFGGATCYVQRGADGRVLAPPGPAARCRSTGRRARSRARARAAT